MRTLLAIAFTVALLAPTLTHLLNRIFDRMSATGHLRTCGGGKSLVCFYQESGPNRSRAGGCTERNPFPYTCGLRVIQTEFRARGIKV